MDLETHFHDGGLKWKVWMGLVEVVVVVVGGKERW